MKSFRRIQICALLMGMGFVPAVAGPPEGDPWLLPLHESPQTWTDCAPTGLEVETGMATTADGGRFSMTNYTTKSVEAELRFEVVSGGKSHHVWTNIEVVPGSAIFTVQYLAPIESSVISVCTTSSIGIIESPDPILSVRQNPDPGGGEELPFGF